MAQVNILISGKATSQSKLDKSAGNGGVAATSTEDSIVTDGAKSSILHTVAIHSLISSGVNITKQIVTDSVSMYGDLTGNYREQNDIENSFKILQGISGVGKSVTGGAVVGGVGGAVVTGVVTVGTTVYSNYRAQRNYSNSLVKQNIQANFNSQRIGNILVGGGRL